MVMALACLKSKRGTKMYSFVESIKKSYTNKKLWLVLLTIDVIAGGILAFVLNNSTC